MKKIFQKFSGTMINTKIIFVLVVLVIALFCNILSIKTAQAAYYSSGNWTSTNLLTGETVTSIDSFVYNLSAKPANTDATIQFSQNNSDWYDSSGTLNASSTLTTGTDNTIDLSGLGWSGANFYYKVLFTSDGVDTPVLDDISVTFTSNQVPNTPSNSSPSDGASGQDLTPTLTGSTYSDPESDSQTDANWQVDDDASFTTPVWTRTAGSAETSVQISSSTGTFANELSGKTELDHNTTYYWRVRYSDGVWSSYSASTSFVTNLVNAPSNSSPADNATMTSLTPLLTSSAFSDDQTGHTHSASQWVIDDNSDFSSLTYDSGETASAETSHAVPGGTLTNYSTYYWKVRYKDSSGFWSSYSTSTQFSIQISETAIEVRPVFGNTIVDQGDTIQIDAQIVNFTDSSPLNTASATISIYNPSGTKIVTDAEMNYISGSNGIYRYPYTIPSTSGSYLYEITATKGQKTSYGASNFEVRTLIADLTSIKSTVESEQTAQTAERTAQATERASSTAERTAQEAERASQATERASSTAERTAQATERASSSAERVAQAVSRTRVEDIQTKATDIQGNVDILIGAMVVVQSTVNDISPASTSFATALTNDTDNFYNNAVLTFTSGDLDGQTRRISDYNGTSKSVTLSPALTSEPANGDAFTIVKQNVYVEEQVAEHETAQAISRTRVEDIQTKTTDIQTKVTDIQSTVNSTYTLLQSVDSKIDTINTNVDTLFTNLQTVDDNVDSIITKWGTSTAASITSEVNGVRTIVDSIRSSQQLNYTVELSDVGDILIGDTYRAKLTILNHESQPTNAVSAPSITIYDPVRSTATSSTMTNISTGVYEATYTVPTGATSGLWETVVSADLGGALPIVRQDYWEVDGSPAQVIINSMSDLSVPSIAADVTISNEGAAGYEYQYEWCVVASEDNACGGGDDVFYSSAAKFILVGEDWDTTLNAIVPNPGSYYFKMVVYYGTEASGASRTFSAIVASTDSTPSSSSGGGSSIPGSSISPVNLDTIYNKLLEVQNELGFHGKTKTAYEDMRLVKSWVGALPGQLGEPMYRELSNISKSISGIEGGSGIDFSSPAFQLLLDTSQTNTASLREMKNKLADLRAVSSVTQRLVQQQVTEPIVETWTTFNSVQFNFLITNPVAETKTLKFKSYLPVEVKPEHIMDLSGLSIDYDSSASSYYVFGNITLGPNEAVTKKVEIKDIWVFSEEEVASLKKQAETLARPLAQTQYDTMAAVLQNEIESTLDTILLRQKEGFRTPQDHIVTHRANVIKMELVKKDLEKMKDLVVQAGSSQGIVGKVGGIQTFATWGIIISIVFGFGLLAVVIFAMWRHQTLMAAAAMGLSRREVFERMGHQPPPRRRKMTSKKASKPAVIVKPITARPTKTEKTNIMPLLWRLPWKNILIGLAVVWVFLILGFITVKVATGLPEKQAQKSNTEQTVEQSAPTEKPLPADNDYKGETIEANLEMTFNEEKKVSPADQKTETDDNTKVASNSPVKTSDKIITQTTDPYLKILKTPTGWLNVRDQGSLAGAIISKVYSNEQYKYTDKVNDWYQIIIPQGKSGWVFGEYVQELKN